MDTKHETTAVDSHGPDRTIWGAGVALAILIAALWLRLAHLGEALLWSDEAFTWRVATRPLTTMIEQVGNDVHPVLYFLLARFWIDVFGDSAFSLRLPSVLAGIACIAAAWILCRTAGSLERHKCADDTRQRRLDGWWAAAFAAAYISFHPLHLEASRTARMYSLLALLTAMSTCILLQAIRTPRSWKWWGLYAMSLGLLVHTHNFGLLYLAGHVAYLGIACLRGDLKVDGLKRAAIAYACAGAAYTPWLTTLWHQGKSVHNYYWINPLLSPSSAAELNYWLLGINTDPVAILPFSLLILAVLGGLMVYYRADRSILFLGVQVAVPWALTIAAALSGRSILQGRYLIGANLCLAALIGLLVARIARGWLRACLAVNVTLPVAVASCLFVMAMPDRAPSVEEACDHLAAHARAGDTVLLPTPGDLNVFRYYMRQRRSSIGDIRCPRPIAERAGGHVVHVASLAENEFQTLAVVPSLRSRRVWTINSAVEPDGDLWDRLARITFAPAQPSYPAGYQLSLFVPAEGDRRVPETSQSDVPEVVTAAGRREDTL